MSSRLRGKDRFRIVRLTSSKFRPIFTRTYEETDNDILENVVGSRGGSTAVTAIVIDGEKVVVANVGDSCRNGEAKQVSVDHEELKEKKMVESKGGFVSHKPGNIPRVDGQLAMTRAFGDGRLKAHITSRPDIGIEKIDEHTESVADPGSGIGGGGIYSISLI
ncbi:probable protein phosphatase 2C 28 [Salvia splendens]|uniref:probable protein phosphatase 2C 28 n=1 Tax=Salvia splendens TaxID=180675 RepID=UPI001C272039|nr:probable protein phosphatase 2C 28 [Salvia splendens]